MKSVCILPLLFIFLWALPRSHPHGDREVPCGISLNHGEGGIMEEFDASSEEEFDASSEVNKRTKRSSRNVMEDHQGSEVEDEDANPEFVELDDYGRSDPPPVTKKPTKKPVQYRIFSRPPAPSPRP